MSESHPDGLGPLPQVGAGPDQESEDVNKEGFAENELLYEVDAVLDPIMALEMFCRSVVPAHRLAYAASIGAAAAEAPPHVVDGTLVPLLKELYKDSYADIRGVALGQTTTTAKVLAGAGPLYRGRLEALWSCLESMLLDGDLENQELAAAALADLAHLLAGDECQGVEQRVCSAVDRLTHVKAALTDEGLVQAMRLVTQVVRPRPGSPLTYESMSHFIAPLFLDQVLKGSEVVREAATAFLPELLGPLTPAQRQELLPPLTTAMVKDKFWNVRAAAAVMLANLLEELKDLDDKERLSIRKHLSHLCDDTSPRVEVSAYMVLGIALPLLPAEEGLSEHPPLLKHFAFAADVPPILQTAAIDPILVPGAVHASASAAAVEMELAAGVGATTAEHDMSGKVMFAGRTRSATAAAAAVAGLGQGGGSGSTGAVWLPRCVAHYLPQVVSHLGAASWHRLGQAWADLVKSKDVAVLRSLLAGTPTLAAALGPELTERDLLPPVIALVNDQLEVVAPVVAQHACALLGVLPRAQQLRLLQLLPALVVQNGSGDAGEWRSRQHIAQQLAAMAALLPSHQVGYRVWPLLLTLCKDPVHAVRVAAAAQAGGVLQHVPAAAGPLGIHLAAPAQADVTSVAPAVTPGGVDDLQDARKAAAADASCGTAPSTAGKEGPGGASFAEDAAGDTGVPSDQSSTAGGTTAAVDSSKTGGIATPAATAAAAGSAPFAMQSSPAAEVATAQAPEQSHASGGVGSSTAASNNSNATADAAAAASGDCSGSATTTSAAAAAQGAAPLAASVNGLSGSGGSGGGPWWRSSLNTLLATGLDLGSQLLEQAAWHYQHYAKDTARMGHPLPALHHHHHSPGPPLIPLAKEDPSLDSRLPLPTVQLLLGDLASMLHSSHANTQSLSEGATGTAGCNAGSIKGWQQRQVCALALGSVLAVAVTGGQAAAVAATIAADKAAAAAAAAAAEAQPSHAGEQVQDSSRKSAGSCQAAAAAATAAVDGVSKQLGQLGIHTANSSLNADIAAAAAPPAEAQAGQRQPAGPVEVAGYGIAAAPAALLDLLHLLLQLHSDPVPGVRVTLVRVLVHLRELLTTAAAAPPPAPPPAAEGTPSSSPVAPSAEETSDKSAAAAGGASSNVLAVFPLLCCVEPSTASWTEDNAAPHSAAKRRAAMARHPSKAAPLLQGEAAAAVLAGVEECLQQMQADACVTVAELAGKPRPPLQNHGLALTEAHLY